MLGKNSRGITKVKRLEIILDRLQRGEKLRSHHIIKIFNDQISKRTAERYLVELEKSYEDKIFNENGKYYWNGEVGIKPFYMKKFEFWYIYMAALSFNSYGVDEKLKGDVIKKLEKLIVLEEAEIFRLSKENIIFRNKGNIIYEYESLIRKYYSLVKFFAKKEIIKLRYKKPNGEVKDYELKIYGFCRAKESFYIVVKNVWGNIFTLRLDRVMSFESAKKKYEIEEEFNLQEYFKNAFEIEVTKDDIEFSLEIFDTAKASILERKWFEEQKVEEVNGKCIFTGRTVSKLELKKWIMGYGSGVKVLKPESLKSEIKKEYKKVIEEYYN